MAQNPTPSQFAVANGALPHPETIKIAQIFSLLNLEHLSHVFAAVGHGA
jgi:hypothetical protein